MLARGVSVGFNFPPSSEASGPGRAVYAAPGRVGCMAVAMSPATHEHGRFSEGANQVHRAPDASLDPFLGSDLPGPRPTPINTLTPTQARMAESVFSPKPWSGAGLRRVDSLELHKERLFERDPAEAVRQKVVLAALSGSDEVSPKPVGCGLTRVDSLTCHRKRLSLTVARAEGEAEEEETEEAGERRRLGGMLRVNDSIHLHRKRLGLPVPATVEELEATRAGAHEHRPGASPLSRVSSPGRLETERSRSRPSSGNKEKGSSSVRATLTRIGTNLLFGRSSSRRGSADSDDMQPCTPPSQN